MLAYEQSVGIYTIWAGQPIDGIRHPLNVEEVWADADLNAVGLFRVVIDDTPPWVGAQRLGTSYARSGNVVIGTPRWSTKPSPTIADVIAERERRLALGFNYDFGNGRGVYHIGTTPADMIGWDEVTKSTQAMIALSQPSATLTIVTNTGPATITALEWQQILLAATAFRQPIWTKSFALQEMTPIPADYTADIYWV